MATRALAARAPAEALQLLRHAVGLDPADPAIRLNLAAAHRALGDLSGALRTLEGALTLDPRMFMALLMKASVLERLGRTREAGRAYGVALTQAPGDAALDEPTRRALKHGRDIHRLHLEEQREFLRQRLYRRAASRAPAQAGRIDHFLDLALGLRKNYRQEPTHFFYPDLPVYDFLPNELFPWLPALEAETASIRAEALELLATSRNVVPYVDYPDTVPLDQWAALNRSPDWSAIHLYLYGEPVAEHTAACPRTMAALDRLPQPHVQERSPAAMFSVLRPRTRIPPHTGVANTRVVLHLPLVVPGDCGFRVGNETRPWREGKAWVFDDTIEHEAWNDGDQVRIVMICDIWRPELSEDEREQIAELMTGMDLFMETPPASL